MWTLRPQSWAAQRKGSLKTCWIPSTERELSALEEMMSAFAFLWHHCVSENLRGGCEWDHPRNIICKYSACFDLWPIAGELCLQQEMMSDTKGNNTSCFASEGALLSFSISLTLSQVLNRLWKTITVKQCDQTITHYARCLPENSMGLVQTHSV